MPVVNKTMKVCFRTSKILIEWWSGLPSVEMKTVEYTPLGYPLKEELRKGLGQKCFLNLWFK